MRFTLLTALLLAPLSALLAYARNDRRPMTLNTNIAVLAMFAAASSHMAGLIRPRTNFMKATLLALAFAMSVPAFAAGKAEPIAMPDFTKGDAIPEKAKHHWNLGPTGLRGWMFCDKMVTSDARQIAITKVEQGSPADGVFRVGDVLLGVGGKPFSYDPRTELGKALTVVESEAGGGKLMLTRWRAGKSEEVVVRLPVLGSYSASAPFGCAKLKRILELGCKALAEKVAQPSHKEDAIVRSLNALALLASGNPAYLPLVKREAEWAAGFTDDGYKTWHYGYVMMLLAEYVMATGDQSVMPGLQRLALEAASWRSRCRPSNNRAYENPIRLLSSHDENHLTS